jgi:hypothetical protein
VVVFLLAKQSQPNTTKKITSSSLNKLDNHSPKCKVIFARKNKKKATKFIDLCAVITLENRLLCMKVLVLLWFFFCAFDLVSYVFFFLFFAASIHFVLDLFSVIIVQ